MRMHLSTLLSCLFIISTSNSTNAQTIEWLTVHDDISRVDGVSQSNIGNNYLISGIFSQITSVSFCDEIGVEINRNEVSQYFGRLQSSYRFLRSLYTSTLENGHHYHFYQNGLVIESNVDFDSIGQFYAFTEGSYIHRFEQVGDLVLASLADETGSTTSQVLLNPITLEIQNIHSKSGEYYGNGGGDVGEDGSLLAFYFTSTTLSLSFVHQDASGTVLLEKDMVFHESHISDVIIGQGNRYYIVGNEVEELGGYFRNIHGFLIALSADGEILWRRDFPAGSSMAEVNFTLPTHVDQLSDHSLVVTGQKGNAGIVQNSKLFLARVAPDGNVQYEKEQSIIGGGIDINKVYVDEQDQIVIVGTAGLSDVNYYQRAFFMKIVDLVGNSNQQANLTKITLTPNPTFEKILIGTPNNLQISEVNVFDMRGRSVLIQSKNVDSEIDVSVLNVGLYTIQVIGDNWQSTELFVKN